MPGPFWQTWLLLQLPPCAMRYLLMFNSPPLLYSNAPCSLMIGGCRHCNTTSRGPIKPGSTEPTGEGQGEDTTLKQVLLSTHLLYSLYWYQHSILCTLPSPLDYFSTGTCIVWGACLSTNTARHHDLHDFVNTNCMPSIRLTAIVRLQKT